MESPPPYMPYRKKSNTGLIIGIIVGAFVLCCILPIGLLAGGGLWIFNKSKGLIQCTYAFEDVRDALKSYAKDHDGKLPAADNWQSDVVSYYQTISSRNPKQRGPFGVMPATGLWGCDDGNGHTTGMALNDDVAGKEISKLEATNDVLLFEIEKATQSAHEKYTPRPESSGPKIFGNPRGWFLVHLSGEPVLLSKGNEVPFNTGPRSNE